MVTYHFADSRFDDSRFANSRFADNYESNSNPCLTLMIGSRRVPKTLMMGIGETGIGEPGIGETGGHPVIKVAARGRHALCSLVT